MKRNLISGAIVVLVLAGALVYHFFTGEDMGSECGVNDDCKGSIFGKLGSQCYTVENQRKGYCTVTCQAKADCPEGWECEGVDFIVRDVKKGASRVCVKRSSGSFAPIPKPPDAPSAAPAPPAEAPR